MIVSCPRCHKQYRLDTSRLNYINLPDNSGCGVQLACSNCHEQWWELKKESVDTNPQEIKLTAAAQPFRNLTDLSLLYKKSYFKHSHQHASGISFSAGENPNLSSYQQTSPKTTKKEKWKTYLLIGFWSALIFGGTIALSLVAMQFNRPLLDFSSSKETPAGDAPIIENIQFDVKPVDDKHQKVIVVGQVKNPNQTEVPLHNIQITAWGTCQQEQTPNEQGLCQIRTWSYKWKQDLLTSEEELTFKSAAKIPANLQVDQIHVDISPN